MLHHVSIASCSNHCGMLQYPSAVTAECYSSPTSFPQQSLQNVTSSLDSIPQQTPQNVTASLSCQSRSRSMTQCVSSMQQLTVVLCSSNLTLALCCVKVNFVGLGRSFWLLEQVKIYNMEVMRNVCCISFQLNKQFLRD